MKTINIHNYEEFAIDYMIGNLSAQEAEAFTSFLTQHPDIADEVLLFETDGQELKPEHKTFNNLKKDISLENVTCDNFEEYCIAAMEGDLNNEALLKLDKYIGDSRDRLNTKAQFEKIRLTPETIAYPHKQELKKIVPLTLFRRRLIPIFSSIAAACIIAFSLFFIIPKHEIDRPLTAQSSTRNIEKDQQKKPLPTKTIIKESNNNNTLILANNTLPHNKTEKVQIEAAQIEEKKSNQGIDNTSELIEKLNLKKITLPNNTITINSMALVKPSEHQSSITVAESTGTTLRSKANKLLYTTVLAQSVKSINKMAETDFEYDVIEDINGNPIRIIMKSRLGEFNRALAQR